MTDLEIHHIDASWIAVTTEDYYVYQLRRSDQSHPFYIGKGKGQRASQHFFPCHLKEVNLKNSIIKSSMAQGVEILIEFIQECMNEESAFALERYLISKYGRRDNGTGVLANHTEGGEGTSGRILSEEEKQASSLRMMGNKSFTGLKHKESSKLKIANANSKRVWSEESRLKMSKSKTGQRLSDEARAAISEKLKSRPRQTMTKESIEKIRQKALERPKMACLHCGNSFGPGMFSRWHGDNCKENKNG